MSEPRAAVGSHWDTIWSDARGATQVWHECAADLARHEAELRARGWQDEDEAATAAAMNFGDGVARERERLGAAVRGRLHEVQHLATTDAEYAVAHPGEFTVGYRSAVRDVLALLAEPEREGQAT